MNPRANELAIRRDLDLLRQLIDEKYLPQLQDELWNSRFLEFAKTQNTAVIRILTKPDGTEARRIGSTPDGYIEDSWDEPETDDPTGLPSLFVNYDSHLNGFQHQLADRLTTLLARHIGVERYARTCFEGHCPHFTYVQNRTMALAHTQMGNCLLPSREKTLSWNSVANTANRLIRSHITDPGLRQLVQYCTGTSRHLTARQYNLAKEGGSALMESLKADHHLAIFYFNNVMRPNDPPPNLRNIRDTIASRYQATPEETGIIAAIAKDPGIQSPQNPESVKEKALAIARTILAMGGNPESTPSLFLRKHSRATVALITDHPQLIQDWADMLPSLIQRHAAHRDTHPSPQRSRRRSGTPPHHDPLAPAAQELRNSHIQRTVA